MKKYLVLTFLLCVSMYSFSAKKQSYGITQIELIQMTHEVVEDLFSENKENWRELLIGTLAVETNLGQYKGNSIYGVAQIRKPGFQFVQNELRKRGEERDFVENKLGKSIDSLELAHLEMDHYLSVLYMAYYYKFILDGSLESKNTKENAQIWKKYYNTKLGSGTVDEFLRAYEKQRKYVENMDPPISVESEEEK